MRSSPYRRILVLLDRTERPERVLGWLRHLARGASDRVHLVMVEPAARAVAVAGRAVAFVDQLEESARASAHAHLEPVASRLREDGLTVQTHVCFGNARGILRAAIEELRADLLVLSDDAVRRDLGVVSIPVLTSGPCCRRSA
jgi:nucleotide-binding universal stress UspA family protein